MNKKIEDYLCYYIGQEVFYLNNEPAILSEISLDSKYSMLVSVKFIKGAKRHFQCKIGDIKLRLRPLSDMTDEEKREYNVRKQRKGYMYKTHAENTMWLTGLGFDVFHLIESGLAVDKTKEVGNATK